MKAPDTVRFGASGQPDRDITPICRGCNKPPADIEEYRDAANEHAMTPAGFVVLFEGTLNRETGGFLCTSCYIAAGCPTAPGGWKAP